MSAPIARRAGPALVISGAALSIASLSSTAWWTSHAETAHVAYDNRFSLWSRTSTKYVANPMTHGQFCSSSDECAKGLWCRNGPRKCWTDGDCRWTGSLRHGEGGSHDCRRMPRSAASASWGKLCSAASFKALPCRSVGAIRALVAASALASLIASASAAVWAAGVGGACGVAAVAVALFVAAQGAMGTGVGLFLHGLGVVFVASGSAVTWASRKSVAQDLHADPKLTTRYGRSFEAVPREEAPVVATAARPPAVTLLQALRAVQPEDGEKGAPSPVSSPMKRSSRAHRVVDAEDMEPAAC